MDEPIKRITVQYLQAGGLDTAGESALWMEQDDKNELLDICMHEYDQLITRFNDIPADDP